MKQRIVCQYGNCRDVTYPVFGEMFKDPINEIEYELLRDELRE